LVTTSERVQPKRDASVGGALPTCYSVERENDDVQEQVVLGAKSNPERKGDVAGCRD